MDETIKEVGIPDPNYSKLETKKSSNKIWFICLFIVVIIILIILLYFFLNKLFYQKKDLAKSNNEILSNENSTQIVYEDNNSTEKSNGEINNQSNSFYKISQNSYGEILYQLNLSQNFVSNTDYKDHILIIPSKGPRNLKGAWVTYSVTLNNPVNSMSINATFLSDNPSESFVSIYWNNKNLSNIDERYALPGEQTYYYILPSTNPRIDPYDIGYVNPGTYNLSFGLDQYSDVISKFKINSINFIFSNSSN